MEILSSMDLARRAENPGRGGAERPEDEPERSACFHCCEPCVGEFSAETRSFCCIGCQAVYSLLLENGLGQFYELSQMPGARIKRATRREQWAFLDDPAVQDKLLDF